jgi:hypothetical protein
MKQSEKTDERFCNKNARLCASSTGNNPSL